MYVSILSIPPEFQSTEANIFLTLLFHADDRETLSNKRVFQILKFPPAHKIFQIWKSCILRVFLLKRLHLLVQCTSSLRFKLEITWIFVRKTFGNKYSNWLVIWKSCVLRVYLLERLHLLVQCTSPLHFNLEITWIFDRKTFGNKYSFCLMIWKFCILREFL